MIEVYGKLVPTELPELVPPEKSALIVVDMQNDVCRNDGSFATQGANVNGYIPVIPRIARLTEAAREAGVLVIFIQTATWPDHRTQSPAQLFFERRMQLSYSSPQDGPFEYCRPGTWGYKVIDELAPEESDTVVTKYRSSSFVGTELDLVLRSNDIHTTVVVGGTTEGCVDSTVRSAGFLEYFPVVPRDCIASDNPELHKAGLTILEAYRAIVVDSSELLALWSPYQAAEIDDEERKSEEALL